MNDAINKQPKDSSDPGGRSARRHFATTSWSMVVEAADRQSNESRDALEFLCQVYWYPLYAFVRRKGHSHADAEELTQGFFAHLLDRDRLQLADQAKGRFRSFLLKSLENFMIQDWRKQTAQKRGGNVRVHGIDFDDGERRYSMEPTDELTAEKLFDRKWAIQILDQALQSLEAHYQERGKHELFEALKPHLVHENTGTLRDVATSLSMSEIAVKVAAHRMRQKYREHLHELISQTVNNDSDTGIEQEIADLFTALRGE